jgi:ketol-acid reductoisomerase
LIAVHPDNDPNKDGLEIAKAYAAATGECSVSAA